MRALIQRVSRSAVYVEGRLLTRIGRGMLILLGIGKCDTLDNLNFLAKKCTHLRLFEDKEGKMNRSILEIGGQALIVPQFTLYANTRKGRRPSFSEASPPQVAQEFFKRFVKILGNNGVSVHTGIFGADMQVEIHNDGPFTLLVECP